MISQVYMYKIAEKDQGLYKRRDKPFLRNSWKDVYKFERSYGASGDLLGVLHLAVWKANDDQGIHKD